ncbi:MAG: alanine racemase [Oscillospiraceae bacterium]|jgi:alanine racemase
MKRLIVDRQIVRSNLTELRTRAGSAEIYAVLEYDAYGLGLEEMALLLRENGTRCFCVNEAEDAGRLRAAGLVDEDILMLRSVSDRNELEELLDISVICTVGSNDAAVALNGVAEARGSVAAVHLRLDTGAGCGFLNSELDKVLAVYQYMPGLAVSGVYTDFSGFKLQRFRGGRQMEEFLAFVREIQAAGYETGVIHACGAGALMRDGLLTGLDAVCIGSALFRGGRGKAGRALRDAAWVEAWADEVRWVPKGYRLGSYKTKRPRKIGLFPAGTYNGCFKKPGGRPGISRRFVNIDGQKARVLGRPQQGCIVADVTKLRCAAGTQAQIPADPMSAKGIKRVYIE